MAETADDLSTPLGQKTARRKRRYRLPFTGTQALAVLLGLFLVTFVGFAIFNDNPLGGEPIARIAIRQTSPAAEKTDASAPGRLRARRQIRGQTSRAAASKRPSPSSTARAARATTSLIIRRRRRTRPRPRPRPAMMAGIDPRLLEKSRYGMIPVVADGLKPFTRLRRRGRPRQGGKNAGGRHRGRRPWRRRGQDHRRHHETAARGDAGVHALRLRSRPNWPSGRARNATRSCCRFRWSRSIIPTTIRGRRPCSRRWRPSRISTGCTGISADSRAMPGSPISWARASSPPTP